MRGERGRETRVTGGTHKEIEEAEKVTTDEADRWGTRGPWELGFLKSSL